MACTLNFDFELLKNYFCKYFSAFLIQLKTCCACLKSPWNIFQKTLTRIFCCWYCCKAAVYSNDDDEGSQSDESSEIDENPGNYTGSNVSKPPTKWEAPSIKNPPAQNDAKQ